MVLSSEPECSFLQHHDVTYYHPLPHPPPGKLFHRLGVVIRIISLNRSNVQGTLLVLQALQQEWVTTRGGLVPRPLAADVPRGAANVAAARRLRNMVHATVALDTGSQDGSQRGAQENLAEYRRRHTADAVRAEQTRGYRLDV